MGEKTGISWTDKTWNPWVGCSKISDGCKLCYFFREAKAYGFDPNRVHKTTTFNHPLRWKEPAKVFTCSWSDFFHESVDPKWLEDAWKIIKRTPWLTYQVLTKRPANIVDYLPPDWGSGYSNVWLGVTVENDKYIWRLDTLSRIPAVLRFASYEPAIGSVGLAPMMFAKWVKWWIAGGESGAQTRLPNQDDFRSVRDQCHKYDLAFFFKQQGGNRKIDGVYGGDLLDGIRYHEFPAY